MQPVWIWTTGHAGSSQVFVVPSCSVDLACSLSCSVILHRTLKFALLKHTLGNTIPALTCPLRSLEFLWIHCRRSGFDLLLTASSCAVPAAMTKQRSSSSPPPLAGLSWNVPPPPSPHSFPRQLAKAMAEPRSLPSLITDSAFDFVGQFQNPSRSSLCLRAEGEGINWKQWVNPLA